MAIRRLKEALDRLPELEGLNHRDEKFRAWREDVKRVLQVNWPTERLADFESHIMSSNPFSGPRPAVTQADLMAYRNGMQRTRTQLELILRNEKELAEAQGNATITELFLPPGSQHDAYTFIRQIISQATQEVFIADNYIDSTLLTLLKLARSGITVSVPTYNVPSDFNLECDKFRKQYPMNLAVRLRSVDFHDRFLILDGKKAYHLGASIKDAGNKASMIHLIQDADNVNALLATYNASWTSARVL
jgi:hypothetical protein